MVLAGEDGGSVELADCGIGVEGRLKITNVLDDVLDDLELRELSVLWHERHEVLQFADVHLDFGVLAVAVLTRHPPAGD